MWYNFDSQATSPRPLVRCAGCNQPLKSYWQPGLTPHSDGHWLVECHNAACHMHMQTLSADEYAGINVSRYRPDARSKFGYGVRRVESEAQ